MKYRIREILVDTLGMLCIFALGYMVLFFGYVFGA
jgi:hypothetical protein